MSTHPNRRNSILKDAGGGDLENKSDDDKITNSRRQSLKRVSFADTTSIKMFVLGNDAVDWHSTYEEPMSPDSSMETTSVSHNKIYMVNSQPDSAVSPDKPSCIAAGGKREKEKEADSYSEIRNFLSSFIGYTPTSSSKIDHSETRLGSSSMDISIYPNQSENISNSDIIDQQENECFNMEMTCNIQRSSTTNGSQATLQSEVVGNLSDACSVLKNPEKSLIAEDNSFQPKDYTCRIACNADITCVTDSSKAVIDNISNIDSRITNLPPRDHSTLDNMEFTTCILGSQNSKNKKMSINVPDGDIELIRNMSFTCPGMTELLTVCPQKLRRVDIELDKLAPVETPKEDVKMKSAIFNENIENSVPHLKLTCHIPSNNEVNSEENLDKNTQFEFTTDISFTNQVPIDLFSEQPGRIGIEPFNLHSGMTSKNIEKSPIVDEHQTQQILLNLKAQAKPAIFKNEKSVSALKSTGHTSVFSEIDRSETRLGSSSMDISIYPNQSENISNSHTIDQQENECFNMEMTCNIQRSSTTNGSQATLQSKVAGNLSNVCSVLKNLEKSLIAEDNSIQPKDYTCRIACNADITCVTDSSKAVIDNISNIDSRITNLPPHDHSTLDNMEFTTCILGSQSSKNREMSINVPDGDIELIRNMAQAKPAIFNNEKLVSALKSTGHTLSNTEEVNSETNLDRTHFEFTDISFTSPRPTHLLPKSSFEQQGEMDMEQYNFQSGTTLKVKQLEKCSTENVESKFTDVSEHQKEYALVSDAYNQSRSSPLDLVNTKKDCDSHSLELCSVDVIAHSDTKSEFENNKLHNLINFKKNSEENTDGISCTIKDSDLNVELSGDLQVAEQIQHSNFPHSPLSPGLTSKSFHLALRNVDNSSPYDSSEIAELLTSPITYKKKDNINVSLMYDREIADANLPVDLSLTADDKIKGKEEKYVELMKTVPLRNVENTLEIEGRPSRSLSESSKNHVGDNYVFQEFNNSFKNTAERGLDEIDQRNVKLMQEDMTTSKLGCQQQMKSCESENLCPSSIISSSKTEREKKELQNSSIKKSICFDSPQEKFTCENDDSNIKLLEDESLLSDSSSLELEEDVDADRCKSDQSTEEKVDKVLVSSEKVLPSAPLLSNSASDYGRCHVQSEGNDLLNFSNYVTANELIGDSESRRIDDKRTVEFEYKTLVNKEVMRCKIKNSQKACKATIPLHDDLPINEAVCQLCHNFVMNQNVIGFFVTLGEDFIELKLKRRPLKIFLDIAHHKDHHMIVRANWTPQLLDLKNPCARLAVKFGGHLISNAIENMIGHHLCSIEGLLMEVTAAYGRVASFLKEITLIQSLFVTDLSEEGMTVILTNTKAHLSVSLDVKLAIPVSKDLSYPTVKIKAGITIGDLRMKSIDDELSLSEKTNSKIIDSIRSVDFFIQNMAR